MAVILDNTNEKAVKNMLTSFKKQINYKFLYKGEDENERYEF